MQNMFNNRIKVFKNSIIKQYKHTLFGCDCIVQLCDVKEQHSTVSKESMFCRSETSVTTTLP